VTSHICGRNAITIL